MVVAQSVQFVRGLRSKEFVYFLFVTTIMLFSCGIPFSNGNYENTYINKERIVFEIHVLAKSNVV
jgi:hypothetical protein